MTIYGIYCLCDSFFLCSFWVQSYEVWKYLPNLFVNTDKITIFAVDKEIFSKYDL